MAGLIRWVRPPCPCRPSKFRFEVEAQRSPWQATLGKKAIGIQVTDLDGERISLARALGRYFAKILSGLILYVGFFMAGWTRRKQGLHDMVAGTLVVRN